LILNRKAEESTFRRKTPEGAYQTTITVHPGIGDVFYAARKIKIGGDPWANSDSGEDEKPPAPIDATVEIRREFDYDNPQTGAGYEQ